MKKQAVVVSAVVLLVGMGVLAQQGPGLAPPGGNPPNQPMPPPMGQPGQEPGRPPENPLEEYLFPPELLMQYQVKIGLTDEQKTSIKEEIQKAQAQFTDLQWKILPETEALQSLLEKDTVDEKQVLAQLDKVLKLEEEIKKTHIIMAIRIKNKLTPDQVAQLKELRKQHPGRRPMK